MVASYQPTALRVIESLGKDVLFIVSTVTDSLDQQLNIAKQINHGEVMHHIDVLRVSTHSKLFSLSHLFGSFFLTSP